MPCTGWYTARMNEQLDILAIGDIVSEPFIRLTDARIIEGEHGQELAMRFGDKIPFESATFAHAVGNAANAAVSAARLGLSSALRAYVGDDLNGKECLRVLDEENVDTSYMVTDPDRKTNHHFVLWYKDDRTILVKHEDFEYDVPTIAVPPKWIYLSSLSANSLTYHHALMELLEMYPDTKLAFQPGTFQMSLGVEALQPLYARSSFFVCNIEEAMRILKLKDEPTIKDLLAQVHALGPSFVVITDGAHGAYAYDGTRYMRVPMYPDPKPPVERTGAGDSFASTVVAALALGKPFEEALLWGPINSMSVVQEIGAQKGLLSREALEAYLADAPADYQVTDL